ncbi:hypothetical protein [uncultured Tenacibaculum sp.]|uniref:hypothetical protein n=1 Tax=uncultured Tenacibaculum sp. TaxID=174713 RepID=UPI002624BE90|nr:hypothetical protein [uncultured Tenacibaculum sp.]
MKTKNILITILGVSFFCVFINSRVLFIDNLIYEIYFEQLSGDQIKELIESKKEWSWMPYVFVFVLIIIRTSLITLCLNIGVFFYDTENKIKFIKLFRVTLIGEFVLVFVGFVRLIYFLFIKVEYTLQDIQQYYPLSYINFLDIKNIEPWLIYPMQTINLFEIAYFFVLVYGLHKLLKNKYSKSFEIVAVSYGAGLIIWLGLVMFLTLNLT